MIIIRWRGPSFSHKESWTQHLLTYQRDDLHPHPTDEHRKARPICLRKQHVVLLQVEICDRRKSNDRGSSDIVPAQRFPAIANDIAVNLRHPEREVEERDGVEVDAAVCGASGGELNGYEEDNNQEETEAAVEGAEFGSRIGISGCCGVVTWRGCCLF